MVERALENEDRARPRPAAAALARLAALLAAERERWPLWLPVGLGAGVVAYLLLPAEPPSLLGAVLTALLAAAGLAVRRPALRAVLLGGTALALGLGLAQLQTLRVAAPMLTEEIGPTRVEGRVVGRDALTSGVRLTLAEPRIEGLAEAAWPAQVRVTVRRGGDSAATGARIAVLAVLAPPSLPAAPGAFDFRRQAFFDRIGAIGYALGPVEILVPEDRDAPALRLEELRQTIAARVRRQLDGDAAGIAVALLTGERGLISREANDAMRDSGLAHLLSISGLHFVMVAGLLFFTARLLLALFEPLALRHPIKKWAAALALAGAGLYALVIEPSPPTQRAFLMTGLGLLAVLLDRTVLSMRLVAWAAVVVLALGPEGVLGPSFQMSFAAVVALIATYEALRGRGGAWRERAGWPAGIGLYLGGVMLTTLVASLATAPFALYHFQRFTTYGLAANLLAVPLTAFWIMPAGLLVYVLLPFGLEGPALRLMGWGIDLLLATAERTAAWPGAVLLSPAMPAWGLGATALGGLWLCLWRRPWRLLGLAGPLIGLVGLALAPRPDILINDTGSLMAVRDGAGQLVLSSARADRFVRDIWLRRNGQAAAETWTQTGPSADGALSCDPLGCLYRRGGRTAALVLDTAALSEDCLVADLIVARVPAPEACPTSLIIDRFDVWRHGAHAVWMNGPAIRIESASQATAGRPWGLRR